MARIGAHSEPKEWQGKIKLPEIGHDYGNHFGLEAKKGQHAYYLGGISFRAVSPKGERTADSQQMYDTIIDNINTPQISMGQPNYRR